MAVKSVAKRADAKKSTPKKARLKKKTCDLGFLTTVIILLVLGLMMVFSASYPSAYYTFGSGYYFIKRQLAWAILGILAMVVTSKISFRKYKQIAPTLFIISLLLLVIVLIPGIGKSIKGARRWLGFGPFTIQPSEIAKITLILFYAYLLEKDGANIKKFKVLAKYALIAAIPMGFMLLQPHFSVCIITAIPLVIMLLVAGARVRYFALAATPVAAIGTFIAIAEPYRLARLTTFLNPFADRLGAGWQIIQSLYAIGSGGIFGLGFGNSRQKFMYVSEPQNDFIFAIICEELGFIGAIAILAVFAVLFWRGMKIAVSAPDTFSSLTVTGIISLVACQVILNIAVVTSSIPTTGIPLPFFSAGGSSLIFLLAAMGIVLNISKYETQKI